MAELIYSALTSLDGYVADAGGNFDWAAPDEEVHAFVNELERPIGTYLYGRKMYEVMRYWSTAPTAGEQPRCMLDYAAIWQAADKVVYSSTLDAASTPRTVLKKEFLAEEVRAMKATADRSIGIGGPHLAADAIRAGLVDEYQVFLNPVVIGGGNRWLPDDVHVALELVDERRFGGGVVYAHYRVSQPH